MLSTKILGTGLLLLVLGLLSASSYSVGIVTEPMAFTIGAISAIIGVVTVVIGFLALAGGEFGKRDLMEAGDSAVFTVGLIRCMVAISVADNHLDDAEVVQIAKIYKHLTKTDIGADLIKQTADDMMESKSNIQDELVSIKPTLTKDLKEKIIIASLYILAADGEMDERELLMLDDIREGLGLPLKRVEKMKADFLSNMKVG